MAGLLVSTSSAISLVSGLLLWAALALEVIGWARSVRSHGRSLALATAAGAIVAALALGVIHSNDAAATDPFIAQR